MKTLQARKKDELIELTLELGLDLPEGPKITKQELLLNLQQKGVTNQKLRSLETKQVAESKDSNIVSPTGMAVVCMDRNNASFVFGKFKFTRERKYQLMPNEIADELISTNSGFRKASGEEVRHYYNERTIH